MKRTLSLPAYLPSNLVVPYPVVDMERERKRRVENKRGFVKIALFLVVVCVVFVLWGKITAFMAKVHVGGVGTDDTMGGEGPKEGISSDDDHMMYLLKRIGFSIIGAVIIVLSFCFVCSFCIICSKRPVTEDVDPENPKPQSSHYIVLS
jgi:hypothetical protein